MIFWQGLTQRARFGLIAGVLVILVAASVAAWWLLHTEYQALFTELKPQDAQAMTTELERLKIPYRLGDSGTSILVDKTTVHETRIKLMGKDLPLHGAVGLELFNNTDFGMTEFAQKINYQRALQGELTRTIQSLSEVREVRVLLALPEQGLFKQATSKAKASITVTMREGQALRAEQVSGIQRLVAAAVPGMTTQDVTIVDSHGVALTRPQNSDGEADHGSARLDLKRDTETYLVRKVAAVLDRAFGPGRAIASVDVTLDMDQVRTTTEDVVPAATRGGLQAAGVVVRERETLRDAGTTGTRNPDAGGSAQRDVEYAVGRRVEQVVNQPGAVRRIQVAAVVREALDASREEQLRKVIAASVGASTDRGDTVVIHSLAGGAISAPEVAAMDVVSAVSSGFAGESGAAPIDARGTATAAGALAPWSIASMSRPLAAALAVALAMMLALVLAFVKWRADRRESSLAGNRNVAPVLSQTERDAALRKVRAWIGSDVEDRDTGRRVHATQAGSAGAGHSAKNTAMNTRGHA